MVFNLKKIEEFNYNSPQEMYQDNKTKKIMGLLDYQSKMIDEYMKEINNQNIALELPTGSGKTLIGLLIAEYRRRKNKERVLFLCPTSQLVNQVAEQAKEKYGITVSSFSGIQKEYNPNEKRKFLCSESIGITTYSSFFATNTFFSDVDVVIMDDVHSCEDYINSSWTIKIDAEDKLFNKISDFLKDYISITDFNNLTERNTNRPDLASWYNIVPIPIFFDNLNIFTDILQNGITSNTSNYYAFSRISENIQDCNIFIANKSILIRPWLSPTITHRPFSKLKQRILMSATLGKSGELERITGLEKIKRLPIVNDWDKKGVGRKFFIFPDLSVSNTDLFPLIKELQLLCGKSVFLVPDNNHAENIKNFFNINLPDFQVFDAQNIKFSKSDFNSSENATVILANRFDGIDFADDESRLLFIWNLPKTTNIQEKFLINRMAASKLYEERIRTRIIQAVGRCSRSPKDYSIVCIFGDTIQNDLLKNENLIKFPPELHAEIALGHDLADQYKSIDNIIDHAKHFLKKSDDWLRADNSIVEARDSYLTNNSDEIKLINDKLHAAAIEEVKFQYYIWKKLYKEAFEHTNRIIDILNSPSLRGYKSYWQFISGCIAYYLVVDGNYEYREKGVKNIKNAETATINFKWLANLEQKLHFNNSTPIIDNDYFSDIIGNLESNFSKIKTTNKLNEKINDILSGLKTDNGLVFENAHRDLGLLLGYESYNPNGQGSPDPYWIINDKLVIVSEDKIYAEKEKIKSIPISHVREALTHKKWIEEHVGKLSNNAEILSIFITNSTKIDENARIYADNLYYISRDNFVQWAIRATTIIRTVYSTFATEGDQIWRESVHKLFIENKLTPKLFLDFIKKKKLNEIASQ